MIGKVFCAEGPSQPELLPQRSVYSTMLFAMLPMSLPSLPVVEFKFESQGREWTVHQAGRREGSEKQPLVVVLHGAGGRGDQYLTKNGWQALAEQEGFLCLAPTGQPAIRSAASNFRTNPNLWNSGQLNAISPRARVNDIGFLDDLLRHAVKNLNVDPARIYMTGHSNGAGMTWRYAAEGNVPLSAIGPVMAPPWVMPTDKSRPVPVLAIYGLEDPLVPWNGGRRKNPWGTEQDMSPIVQELGKYAKGMGGRERGISPKMAGPVQRYEFGPLRGGAPFTALTIEGQGHGWPGGQASGLPSSMTGPDTSHLDATAKLWDFFKKY